MVDSEIEIVLQQLTSVLLIA